MCHTYWDTGQPIIMVISEDTRDTHTCCRAFDIGAVTTCTCFMDLGVFRPGINLYATAAVIKHSITTQITTFYNVYEAKQYYCMCSYIFDIVFKIWNKWNTGTCKLINKVHQGKQGTKHPEADGWQYYVYPVVIVNPRNYQTLFITHIVESQCSLIKVVVKTW